MQFLNHEDLSNYIVSNNFSKNSFVLLSSHPIELRERTIILCLEKFLFFEIFTQRDLFRFCDLYFPRVYQSLTEFSNESKDEIAKKVILHFFRCPGISDIDDCCLAKFNTLLMLIIIELPISFQIEIIMLIVHNTGYPSLEDLCTLIFK
ncbi:MAG: hypothetical protein LBJ93_00580 [Clostridiales bacterium]|nr:hypothetical protein [Clostridiales bacterium]